MAILTKAKVYRTFVYDPVTGNPAIVGARNFFEISVNGSSMVTDIRTINTSTGSPEGNYGAMLISNAGPADALFQLSSVPNVHINPGFGNATLLPAGTAFLYDEQEPATNGIACYVALMTANQIGNSLVTIIRGATSKVVYFEDSSLSANPVQSASNPNSSSFKTIVGTPT